MHGPLNFICDCFLNQVITHTWGYKMLQFTYLSGDLFNPLLCYTFLHKSEFRDIANWLCVYIFLYIYFFCKYLSSQMCALQIL